MTGREPPREARPDWRRLAETWLLAWLAAAALAGAAVMAVIEGGLFDATASTPHYPPVGWAAHAAFISSVKARAGDIRAPAHFSPAETLAGFHEYDRDCAMCHGGPGVARAAWVQGLTPTPPYLLDAARRWSPAQLYWIVGQGIKMTAMPAWRLTRTEGEVWNLVAFLEILPYLTADDYARMRAADGAAPAVKRTDGRPGRATGAPRS
ncbi:MAG: c-type cytochrome [Caulobacteraceae bacterium]